MPLRLRQICLVAPELAPAIEELRPLFGLEVCYRDPAVAQFGLENSLLPVGHEFLEVVAPVREDTAAGRYLERRGGAGGYMVITQCDDLASRNRHVEALGLRIAFAHQAEDFDVMQLHPRDTGGSFFEIDYQRGDDRERWWPAGPDPAPARRTDVVRAIRAAELQSPDPERLGRRWAEIAGAALERDDADRFGFDLENARLRFVPCEDGRPEGLGGIDLAAVDRARIEAEAARRGLPLKGDTVLACGTRFRLVDGSPGRQTG